MSGDAILGAESDVKHLDFEIFSIFLLCTVDVRDLVVHCLFQTLCMTGNDPL